jgi:hypothetical protein
MLKWLCGIAGVAIVLFGLIGLRNKLGGKTTPPTPSNEVAELHKEIAELKRTRVSGGADTGMGEFPRDITSDGQVVSGSNAMGGGSGNTSLIRRIVVEKGDKWSAPISTVVPPQADPRYEYVFGYYTAGGWEEPIEAAPNGNTKATIPYPINEADPKEMLKKHLPYRVDSYRFTSTKLDRATVICGWWPVGIHEFPKTKPSIPDRATRLAAYNRS